MCTGTTSKIYNVLNIRTCILDYLRASGKDFLGLPGRLNIRIPIYLNIHVIDIRPSTYLNVVAIYYPHMLVLIVLQRCVVHSHWRNGQHVFDLSWSRSPHKCAKPNLNRYV